MQKDISSLRQAFSSALEKAQDILGLEELRVEFLGRKGKLQELMKAFGALTEAERRLLGEAVNEAKEGMEAAFAAKEQHLTEREAEAVLQKEWMDVTLPGIGSPSGHLHPVSHAIAEITDIFARLGFSRVRAPEIDWDYYAFESLNMPADHPARDDWETFFVSETDTQISTGKKGRIVLTPHTSNSQVRQMEAQKPPLRFININRTYRRQSDITHVPMFHQFEGVLVDKDVSVAHLKGVLDYFARSYFGKDRVTRLRPHHFRFTEPSFEVDISCGECGGSGKDCRVCKGGWVELGGAGMIHPHVLTAGGIDPTVYSGFAFGWGVERTLAMRSAIDDIRVLYRNDLRFVEQF